MNETIINKQFSFIGFIVYFKTQFLTLKNNIIEDIQHENCMNFSFTFCSFV